MIFSEYMSRMEAANMKLNAYIKTDTRAILAFSESLSNLITPYTITLSRKECRKFLAGTGLEKYEITERLFPKKKKRGSMRRARRDKEFTKFLGTLPSGVYIDEWDYKNDPHSVTDIFDPPEISPISIEEIKASFSTPWPGPFEGEEES